MTAARLPRTPAGLDALAPRPGFVPFLTLLALAAPCASAWAGRAPHKPAPAAPATSAPAAIKSVILEPTQATLDGSYAFQTLAAVGQAGDGSQRDLTDGAAFTSSNPGVVKIGKDNVAYPVGDGTADVTVTVGGHAAKSHIVVKNSKTDANLGFETAITPILVKNGCTGSACHGAPNGQGGFKLSFFGYESQKDWDTIVKGDGGRRIDPKKPRAKSLFSQARHAPGTRRRQAV